jgi:hypothetical protein
VAKELDHPRWIFGRNRTDIRNDCLLLVGERDINRPEIVFQLVHTLGPTTTLDTALDDRSRKGVDSDPLQHPILFARREEAVQSLISKFLWNKQLRWPSFERLPSKIDFDRRRPARNTSAQKVAPSLLIFVALDHESIALVPLDVKKRKLVVGRGDRSAVPDRTRPKAREDLRHGRNRRRCLVRDEREPKRVLEVDAHGCGFSES